MTIAEVQQLSHRELDEKCAILLGWKRTSIPTSDQSCPELGCWEEPVPNDVNRRHVILPYFSSDANDASDLEDAIIAGHKSCDYIRALRKLLGYGDRELSYIEELFVIHASPRKRAEAFVLAMTCLEKTLRSGANCREDEGV